MAFLPVWGYPVHHGDGYDAPRMLTQLADDLWVDERPLHMGLGQDLGCRMTVVRLPAGRLWLHSPVELTRESERALGDLGTVHAVVAPNRSHHRFVPAYLAAFPEARLFGAPGLQEKRKDLSFHEVLQDVAPPDWEGQLEQHWVFGAPFLNEVVFFHPKTRTLILTDLAFNVPERDRRRARLFYFLSGAPGRFGPHRFIRSMIRDREAVRASIERMLSWDFARVIVSHGDVLEQGGRDQLRSAFEYLYH